MTRLLTLVTYLLACWCAYRAGYQAARIEAVQPYWHVSRERVAWALRQVGR